MHLSPYFNPVEGWQQLLMLFIPICTLFLGLAPFEITIFNVLVTLFFPIISYLMLQELGCGFSRLWTNEIFSMARWPLYIKTSESWFGVKLQWSSSLKNIKGVVNWRLMMPQIFLLFVSCIALIFSFYTLNKVGFKTGPLFLFFKQTLTSVPFVKDPNHITVDINAKLPSGYTIDLVIIAGMWVIYNAIRAIFSSKK